MRLNLVVRTTLVAAGLCSASAFADPVYIGHVDFANSYGSEYRVHLQYDEGTHVDPAATGLAFQGGAPAGAGYFESFSLEMFEGLDAPASEQYKGDLNLNTVAQSPYYSSDAPGGDHGGFQDGLDARTAYLYTHFISMNLTTGYDYANAANRAADSNALQQAIWFIEQESSDALSGRALDYFNEANNAVMSGAWTGLGSVRVMNVYTNSSRMDYQDMLIIVPLPGGAGLAGMGLAGLTGVAALRRRRTR